jgi:energy-coupling factor transport system permease protein
MSTATSFHLLRHVPIDSIIHRADARSKVLALTVIALTLSFDPSWSTTGAVWLLLGVAVIASRVPRTAVPRPPRALRWGIGLSLLLGLLASGEPNLTVAGTQLGIGGLIFQIRFLAVSFAYLFLALMLGWTTPLGALPGAATWMLAPLRALRVPTDDVVVGLALSVRALPLLAEELSTAAALRSARPRSSGNRLTEALDVAATATVAATRRGRELGDALTARGLQAPPPDAIRFGFAEVLVLAAAGAIVGVALVT